MMSKKAVLPIPIFIVLLVVLALLDIDASFGAPALLFILNTLFLSGVSILVAYLAARGYLQTGLRNLLLLGCGALVYGLAAFAAGWFVTDTDGQNINLTVFNTGALFGAICHLAAAGLEDRSLRVGRLAGPRYIKASLALLGVLLFIAGLTVAARQGVTPLFFVPGAGPTLLRQVVLGSATFLYALSAVLVLRLHTRTGSEFLYWYALGLGLTAVGLFAVLLLRTFGSPVNWTGRAAQYLGGLYFLQAVLMVRRSARVQLESAIANFFREAETNYRILMEMATDAVIAFDRVGRILVWNPAAERIFGYRRAEAIGAFFTELIVPEPEVDRWRQELQGFGGEGESQLSGRVVERDLKRKDNQLFPAELSISGRKSAGSWVGSAIIRDISERKQAEETLRRSEALYRAIARNLPDGGVAVVGRDMRYLVAEGSLWSKLGLVQEELEGRRPLEIFGEREAQAAEERYRLALDGETRSYETEYKDSIIWSQYLPLRDEKGQVLAVMALSLDITGRVRMEEQLRASLQEKEVLLREVNHRVKNNLQAILNLLYLQMNFMPDADVRRKFEDIQARIKSIALIHEQLYQSQNFTRINFTEYLENLLGQLIRSYRTNPDLICLEIKGDGIEIGVDMAVPLGIIVNELVSNALKHAFSDYQPGKISIELRQDTEDCLRLTVEDDGQGLPRDKDVLNTGSLGLNLVQMLAGHMGGKLELEHLEKGTRFIVTVSPVQEVQ